MYVENTVKIRDLSGCFLFCFECAKPYYFRQMI
nr:MAG TPA: hypothetical protein [Caudoviricetes sp.]